MLCFLQAFLSFDKEAIGHIPFSDFRRILDNFCFKTTEPQFKMLCRRYIPLSPQGGVDYQRFIDSCTNPLVKSASKFLGEAYKCVA